MSDEKKSPIVSTSVSMNTGKKKEVPQEQKAACKKVSVPWHILVCADFGFVSDAPEQVRAASLNEFLESHNIVLRGNIESSLAGRPVFVEYSVRDSKDFSSTAVPKNLTFTADLNRLTSLLQDVLSGSVSRVDALSAIHNLEGCYEYKTEALKLLHVAPPASGQSKQSLPLSKEKSSALDSILDSVSIETSDEEKEEKKSSAVDKLTEALVGGTESSLPKQKIQAFIDRIEAEMEKDLMNVLSKQFFHDRRASWAGCRHAAKIIGRNNDVSLSIFSAPFADIDAQFSGIFNTMIEQGTPPDIILLDYPMLVSNSHAHLLSRIGKLAESHHAMVISCFSQDEPFISRIPGADTLKPIFEEPHFIPYHRLRKNSFARTICMAAPHAVIDSEDIEPVAAGGGWLVLFSLVQRICDGRSPFSGGITLSDTGITAEYPLRHAKGMNHNHTLESLEMGITLLSDILATKAGVPAVSIIESEGIASQYCSFAYNLLTNRLLKITGTVIAEGGGDRQEIVARLRLGLLEFLDGYRLLHSEDEVMVSAGDSGEINVAVDSQKTVDEYPVQIQFSVNL